VSPGTALIVGIGGTVLIYGLAVLALAAAGKRSDARALATFIPDCIVLFGRLLKDPGVPRRRKLLLLPLLAYLAFPIDLVPDFIPVAGQLDDAILAALVLRYTLRGGDPALLIELWPGPPEGLRVISRLAFG
jgi:uncharacterized membrane protein YkvA (DUF1232 family)